MKLKALPLAIAAAMTAPGIALADGPTVYGKLNVSYEMVDWDYGYDFDDAIVPNYVANNSADNWELISNASRVGVKGDAAINNDLKAVYQIEFGLSADGDGSTWSNRDRYVGLAGGFGTFKVGQFDSPLKTSQGKVDQFNDLSGDIQSIFLGENRPENILQYSSPSFSGVQVNFAFIPGEELEIGQDNSDVKDGPADAFSTSVTFSQDMIYAALAYDSEVASTYRDGLFLDLDEGIIGFSSGAGYFNTLRLVGVVTLNDLQLGAMYQAAETADADMDGDIEQDGFLLSASYKINQLVLKGQYGATTLSDNDINVDSDAEQFSVGADYLLSKQTTVFAYYNTLSYEDDVTNSEKQSKDNLGVGIVHNF